MFDEIVAQLYLFSVQKKLFQLKEFRDLCNYLNRIDGEQRIKKEIDGLVIQYIPILFVHAPHYVLRFHFDAFLEGVDKTHHFNANDWYPFVVDNSDVHVNWLLAGMRKYNLLCRDVSDLGNMNQFLKTLSSRKSKDHSGCPAFQHLKELDYVTCMSIIKRYPDMINPISRHNQYRN